jgi:ribosome-associated heat shock protein Hsp15
MYKSRTLAASAIKAGKVKIGSVSVKPAHMVKPGEVFTLNIGGDKKIIEVISLTDKRRSFDIASTHYKDLSPPPEKKEVQPSAFYNTTKREKGLGRPTKKDRRDIESFGEK